MTLTTTPVHLAVIGTAGRDASRPMTGELWDAMCEDLHQRLLGNEHLVSGGAAWADHLAVHAYHCGWVKELTLFLPAPLGPNGFIGPTRSAASAANYYHQRFSQATGRRSYDELCALAGSHAATLHAELAAPGYGAMFTRNKKVAQAADGVVAYTFGHGDSPADGGTLNTWQQIRGTEKVHVDLGALLEQWRDHLSAPAPQQHKYTF